MRRALAILTVTATLAGLLLAFGAPALADHTDPGTKQAQTPDNGVGGFQGATFGEGDWDFVANFPPNLGSDLILWERAGSIWSASGTLGQAQEQAVGQRILRLTDPDGTVNPTWIADHGSAACEATPQTVTGTTGLQHDSEVTPREDPEVLLDTTDSLGRCHDPQGGGLELIDVSGVGIDPDFEVREIHLTRHSGTAHTVSVDAARPWIVYNNNSDGGAGADGLAWIDVLDIRSCLTASAGGLLPDDATLEDKRDDCRPEVFRIPFEDEWASRVNEDGELENPHGCHDITTVGDRIYCASLNATLIFDVSGMTDEDGSIKGEPLPCEVRPSSNLSTTAMVTDCIFGAVYGEDARTAWEEMGSPQAEGWEFLGRVNHAGRPAGQANNNLNTPSDEEVSVSHQSDPLPDAVIGDHMIVSDERGGAVVLPGASCDRTIDNPYGNGGLHFYDISNPGPDAVFEHATMVDADGNEAPAIWRGQIHVSSPSFCTVHVFHHVPDEQRLIMGYYTHGTKVLDYSIDEQGRFQFTEVASFILPDANTWVTRFFRIDDNDDGTRTYHLMANDINRGIDVFSWTHTPNPIQEPPEAPEPPPTAELNRFGGVDRVATAVEVSQTTFETADTVVLARADEYADALAGAPLATQLAAPLLLTHSDELPDNTAAEIERLGASEAVLLGGEDAISPTVQAELLTMGVTSRRVAGGNRFETAAAVAQELGDAFDTAFVAEGEHEDATRGWPDALTAAPYAAFTGQPVLLVNRDRLPEATAQALSDLGVTETVVVGGPAAVSDEVVAEIEDAGHGPRRVFGETRYDTAFAVYQEAVAAGMDPDALWLATGANFPDALTAGPAVAAAGQTLLLTEPDQLSSQPAGVISERRDTLTAVDLLGGTEAISAAVEQQIADLLQPEEPAAPPPPPSGGPPPPPFEEEAQTAGVSADVGLALLALALLPLAALLGRRRRLT